MTKIFISYSHDDLKHLDYLVKHLKPTTAYHDISPWSDKQILGGENWEARLEAELVSCDAAILLITSNFVASDFIKEVEVPRLLGRRQNEGLHVWPLNMSPADIDAIDWLKAMQWRPSGDKTVLDYPPVRRERMMVNFAKEVRSTLRSKGSENVPKGKSVKAISFYNKNTLTDEQIEELERTLKVIGVDDYQILEGSVRVLSSLTEEQIAEVNALLAKGAVTTEGWEFSSELDPEEIIFHVYEFRNQRVMTDAALALFYGVSTKHLNQAVKRNSERFNKSHCFQLNKSEWDILRSQTVTAKRGSGGRRSKPYVFTQTGVLLCATILRSAQANRMSEQLVEVFISAHQNAMATQRNDFPGSDKAEPIAAMKKLDERS